MYLRFRDLARGNLADPRARAPGRDGRPREDDAPATARTATETRERPETMENTGGAPNARQRARTGDGGA